MLVGAAIAIYAGYFVLIRALVAVRNWAVRTSVAVAQLLGVLLCLAPCRSSSNCCAIKFRAAQRS